MQLQLKNQDLATFLAILEGVAVRSMAANRGRARLLRHVRKKLADFMADELEILKVFLAVDASGEFVRDASEELVLQDPGQLDDFNEHLKELADEVVVMSAGDDQKRYLDYLAYLSGCDEDFSAQEVLVVDDLLEQYECFVKENKGDQHETI